MDRIVKVGDKVIYTDESFNSFPGIVIGVSEDLTYTLELEEESATIVNARFADNKASGTFTFAEDQGEEE
jgi:beta-xylosidase